MASPEDTLNETSRDANVIPSRHLVAKALQVVGGWGIEVHKRVDDCTLSAPRPRDGH